MKICPKCGKEHKKDGIFCSRSCANGRVKTEETKQKIRESILSSPKFKTTLDAIKEQLIKAGKRESLVCPICGKIFQSAKSNISRYCSRVCYLKDEHCEFRKHGPGGYYQGSSRGKHGWYKGYWCDSSWELAWVIYNLDHGIKFKRNHQGFQYEFEGKKHKYYPDFILEDGSYVEIKSVLDDKNKAKISSFNGKLILLMHSEIKSFVEYAIQKHGKKFINLYEAKN